MLLITGSPFIEGECSFKVLGALGVDYSDIMKGSRGGGGDLSQWLSVNSRGIGRDSREC